jgi:hypothetical protein
MLPSSRGRHVRVGLAAVAAVALVVAGVTLATAAQARQEPAFAAADDQSVFGANAKPIAKVPANDASRGLSYDGLIAAKTGPCVGGYQVANVKDRIMCTHGPDPFPPGINRNTVVNLLPAPKPGIAGPSALAVCEGDGSTGKRVEVLYVHGNTDRYSQVLETLRTVAEGVDTIYNESAKETGGERHVRFVTETVNGQCRPAVRNVAISQAAIDSADWAPVVNEVRALGWNRTDRLYMEFTESDTFCGIGGFRGDTRKSDANRSNTGPEYGRSDVNCWNPGVAAHELGHNLGAVNNNAPNASGFAHCVEEWDVMCYKDNPATVLVTRCTDRAHDQRLDCNHDDYYNTNPAAGSYLANNFNVADNLFLIKGPGGTTTTTTTRPPTTTTAPPGGQNRALTGTPSTSFVSAWESLAAVNDNFTPTSSADRAHPVYGNWPQQGTQWVQYTWSPAVTLNRVSVYWFDDNQGIDLPASCNVQFWNGSAWQNVSGASACGVAPNTFNTVTFTTVTTTQIRLNIVSRSGFSTGILELRALAP